MRATWIAVFGGCALVAVACGSFGSDPAPAPEGDGGTTADGGVDGSVPDGASDAPDRPDASCVDCARTIFVLSEQLYGDFGGLDQADGRCQAQADAPGSLVSGRAFVAWLSTDTVSAADRVVHGTGPYKTPKGATLADTFDELLSMNLASPVNEYADGTAIDYFDMWTGTYQDGGKAAGATCSGWTTRNGEAARGANTQTDQGEWTFIGLDSCSTDHRIYCIEK